jgi:hypothetical protein
MGADLSCTADLKAGCLNLYLPRYLGDNAEHKKNPSFNGLRPVGQVQRGAEGTIHLRIIPTGQENLDIDLFDYPAVEGLVLRRVGEPPKAAPEQTNRPNQATQILDMVLKGFRAYQDSNNGAKGKQSRDKASRDEALLKASQLAYQIAKAVAEAYYDSNSGTRGKPSADKASRDLYAETFLKAFELSSEIAKAVRKGKMKLASDEAVFDAYGPAFVKAYERAQALKKVLADQKSIDATGTDKTIEALDVFLKAGKELEQVIKQRAKTQAVQRVKKEIDSALRRLEKTAQDQRTFVEALNEIERVVREMRRAMEQRKERK